jgi:hypothetical protein
MMLSFDYLYYKLYRATLVGSLRDIAPFAAMVYFSGLLFLNLLVISIFLRKVGLMPSLFTGKRQVVIFMVCFIVVNYFLFLHTGRFRKIITKYETESESRRKKGNLVVWLYVIISILLMFAVAFYKPGVV